MSHLHSADHGCVGIAINFILLFIYWKKFSYQDIMIQSCHVLMNDKSNLTKMCHSVKVDQINKHDVKVVSYSGKPPEGYHQLFQFILLVIMSSHGLQWPYFYFHQTADRQCEHCEAFSSLTARHFPRELVQICICQIDRKTAAKKYWGCSRGC